MEGKRDTSQQEWEEEMKIVREETDRKGLQSSLPLPSCRSLSLSLYRALVFAFGKNAREFGQLPLIYK